MHTCALHGASWPRPGSQALDGLISSAQGQVRQKLEEPTYELGREPASGFHDSQSASMDLRVRPPLPAAFPTALSMLPNLSKPVSSLDWRGKYLWMKVKIKWDNPWEAMRWELTLCQPWLVLAVTLDTCHPGLPPGGHIHTYFGSKRYENQKWAVGAKACLQGRLRRTPFSQFNMQHLSQLQQCCRFLVHFLSRARGSEGTPLPHHSASPRSQWGCQTATKV